MIAPFFDTNIMIDWLLDRGGATNEIAAYDGHRISRIVWAEILAGIASEHRSRTQNLLDRFDIVELDERIAAAAADLRHRTRLKLLDAFIYATAQVHDGVLITRNTRDFPDGTPGVRVPYTL